MSQWYRHNHRLFGEERELLAASYSLMMLSVVGADFPINSVLITKVECVVAHGIYILNVPEVHEEIEYGITMCLPEKYPRLPPVMYCNDPNLPIDSLDRHILKDGQACLEVRPEIKRRWSPGSNLVDFLINLVDPFIAWQAYYDAFDKPPKWGERAHGSPGIIEYYAELLGISEARNMLGFMKLLARKNPPKGHELCPCDSGLKLRNCHRDVVNKGRDKIHWQNVSADVELIALEKE